MTESDGSGFVVAAQSRQGTPMDDGFRYEREALDPIGATILQIPAQTDAEFAEAWIRHMDARHTAAAHPQPPEVLTLRDRLIRRYGVLFRGRRLLCRGCLGIRYGEVKKREPS